MSSITEVVHFCQLPDAWSCMTSSNTVFYLPERDIYFRVRSIPRFGPGCTILPNMPQLSVVQLTSQLTLEMKYDGEFYSNQELFNMHGRNCMTWKSDAVFGFTISKDLADRVQELVSMHPTFDKNKRTELGFYIANYFAARGLRV